MCKELKAQILISGIDESLIASKSIVICNRGEAKVKGRRETIRILEIIDPNLLAGINLSEISELAKVYAKKLEIDLSERLTRVSKAS